MKSQTVRLIDVFALGPFMVWFGHRSKLPDWARGAMMISGAATIAYNGRNYLRAERPRLESCACQPTPNRS